MLCSSSLQEFGDIEYVRVLTEKGTGKSKGLAFVKYFRAYHSALAMEMCDPSKFLFSLVKQYCIIEIPIF